MAPGVLPLTRSCFCEVTNASATSGLVSDTRVIGVPTSSTVDCPTMISTVLADSIGAPSALAAAGRAGAAGDGIATVDAGTAVVAGASTGGAAIGTVGTAIVAVGAVIAAVSGRFWACRPSVPQTAVTRIETPATRTQVKFCR